MDNSKKAKQLEVKFLDYEIIDTGNGDGIVLMKSAGDLYECHLGNYSSVESAQKSAIRYFMIARPSEFSAQVEARMRGSHVYFDYFKFVAVLKKERIAIPPGMTASSDGNMILTWNGETI